MIISKLISKIWENYIGEDEVEFEDFVLFLSHTLKKDNLKFKIGDIVKITNTYPEYTCVYIGNIGNFDYGKTNDGFGPTEAIRLDIAMYTGTTGEVAIITSIAPSGVTEYATEEEIVEFNKTIERYGYIL